MSTPTICPHCGKEIATENPAAKPWKNSMSVYVREDGSAFGLMNEDSETVIIPANPPKIPTELKLIREDVYAERKVIAARTPAAPPSTKSNVPPPPSAS